MAESGTERPNLKDRIGAVLQTLGENPSVSIDAAILPATMIVSEVVGTRLMGMAPEQAYLLGALFSPLTANLLRPAINQSRNEATRKEAALGDWGSYAGYDEKLSLEYLVRAFQTGKFQPSESVEGYVDSGDKAEYSGIK